MVAPRLDLFEIVLQLCLNLRRVRVDVDEVRVGKARAFVLRVGRERLQRARRAFAKTAQICLLYTSRCV